MDTGRLENPLSKTRTNSKLMKLWHLAKYQSRATRIRSKCPTATTNTLIQPLNYIREVHSGKFAARIVYCANTAPPKLYKGNNSNTHCDSLTILGWSHCIHAKVPFFETSGDE